MNATRSTVILDPYIQAQTGSDHAENWKKLLLPEAVSSCHPPAVQTLGHHI